MNTTHRHASRMLVAALLSVLSCTATALPTPPTWTSENYLLWYYVENGASVVDTGYVPSASGSSSPNISQTHLLGSSNSSGEILLSSATNTYTMNVRTAGVGDSYQLSSAYLDLGFSALAGEKLYVSYTLAGEAIAEENGDYSASGVESSIKINGEDKFVLGNGSGLYDDNEANTGDLEQVNILDGLLEFDLVAGTNSFYMDMDAWSDTLGASPSEAWLTATFRFSLTPFSDPPAGSVAEPNGLALLALGLLGLVGIKRRR